MVGGPYEPDFEVLIEGPFRRDELTVEHVVAHDLRLDAAASRFVDLEWQQRLELARVAGLSLYDGALWRIGDYKQDTRGLHLYLGAASYRQYVGTRHPSFFANRPRSELANPLGICCATVTADGRLVLARRSGVDVASGQYSTPGGFVERGKDVDSFAAMARELREELDVVVDPMDLVCTGLIYDRRYPHYELCFTCRVPVTLTTLGRLQPMEPEADFLCGVPDEAGAIAAFVNQYQAQMSPSGAACLVLYARYRFS